MDNRAMHLIKKIEYLIDQLNVQMNGTYLAYLQCMLHLYI